MGIRAPRASAQSRLLFGNSHYTVQYRAFELRGSGVLVNYLDPGWLMTDMGGPNAQHPVETVLPGALVPALLEDDGPNGQFFAAQDYRGK